MDEIARYNQARWKALAAADALFTRPHWNLTIESAREKVDPDDLLGEVAGKSVLCLAGGGGQQSAAFALLGAKVTVVDLSPEQLERDREAAIHYGTSVETIEGDMRDLSALPASAFDIVVQPYSLGFVPDASVVFAQIARVLKSGGIYQFNMGNPFTLSVKLTDWNGQGYVLSQPYREGVMLEYPDQEWVYDQESAAETITPPREYRHTLSVVLNSLIGLGFELRHLSDSRDMYPDTDAEPGTWDHFVAYAPPFLTLTWKLKN
jgi:SAM-dependent methyltransferase